MKSGVSGAIWNWEAVSAGRLASQCNSMKKLIKSCVLWLGLAAAAVNGAALGQDRVASPAVTGFYGGVSLRDPASATAGVNLSPVSSAWAKFGSVIDDENGPQSLLFGGYRFAHDVSVEAAFAHADSMALPMGRGMGLALGSAQPGRWNADVYTSYNVVPAFALYGRLGYKQLDPLPAYLSLVSNGSVAGRQGANYGVGLRYDMTPSLGLKLEYARFGRFAFDTFSSAFPDTDQVQIGVQYRF